MLEKGTTGDLDKIVRDLREVAQLGLTIGCQLPILRTDGPLGGIDPT